MFFPELAKGRKVLRGSLVKGNLRWEEQPAALFNQEHFDVPDDGKWRFRKPVQGACLQFAVPFATVALTAATAKTVVGVKCATNVCLRALEIGFGFDGATSTNAAVVCEIGTCTWATNSPGTNSTSVTPAKQDTGRAETIQATAGKTWTTEPTTITVLQVIDLPQYNGFMVLPLAQWYSTLILAGGNGLVLRLTSPNNVNVSGYLKCEE